MVTNEPGIWTKGLKEGDVCVSEGRRCDDVGVSLENESGLHPHHSLDFCIQEGQ